MNPTRIVPEAPFPPSVHNYYIRTKFGVAIFGAKGKQFRKEGVYLASRQVSKSDDFSADKILYLSVAVFAPDRRKRDLDKILKAGVDSLTHAGVLADDSQIDHLEVIRKSVQKNDGRVIITIEEIV